MTGNNEKLASRKREASQQDKMAPNQKEPQQQQQQKDKLAASLIAAASEGKVELVRLLLRCGADVNAQDEQFGNTALHHAAWNGFSETVQVLCKHRANTSIRNKAQFTPLHMACQQGHNQTARLLLMANAKTEAKNSYGDTPLHTAARYGHAGVARILLSAKSNPNQVNKNHDTPLHIAAAMARRKLTKIFVQNGAEPAIKNKQEETAMDIALRKNLIDIQELIANPPPVKSSSSSTHHKDSHRLSGSSPSPTDLRHQQQHHDTQLLSRLERRYGQLYGSHQAMASSNVPPVVNPKHRHAHHRHKDPQEQRAPPRPRHLRTRHRSKYNLHDDLDADTSSDEDGEGLEGFGSNQQVGHANELAVDVPPEMRVANEMSAKQKLVNNKQTSGLFTSVNSLANGELLMRTKSSETTNLKTKSNRLRTKTIGDLNSADLHLLPALMSSRSKTPTNALAAAAATATDRLDPAQRATSGACLAPDAREDPQLDWMMMGVQQQSNNNSDNNCAQLDGAHSKRAKSASPQGSLRSSRGSRGRSKLGSGLTVRHKHRKSNGCGGPTLIVRKPNGLTLGASGAKLSLLRVARAGSLSAEIDPPKQQQQQPEERPSEATKSEEVDTRQKDNKSEIKANRFESLVKGTQNGVALGRRQERLEQQAQSKQQVAPNGTQLVKTRPLAPLSDDSQLYAIPRKPKANNNNNNNINQLGNQEPQVVEHFKSSDLFALGVGGRSSGTLGETQAKLGTINEATSSAEPQPPKGDTELDELRVASGGPALTSDGGHTSASSSPSGCDSAAGDTSRLLTAGSGCATPPSASSNSAIASSSDECVDLICSNRDQPQPNNVQLVGVRAERDLYAGPGYSTVAGSGEPDDGAQAEVECLCGPLLSGAAKLSSKQECDTQTGAALTTTTTAAAKKKQQVVAGAGINGISGPRAASGNGAASNKFNGNHIMSETRRKAGAEQQQVASSSGGVSKLRQLLHLESRASKDRKTLSASATSAAAAPLATATSGQQQQPLRREDNNSKSVGSGNNNTGSSPLVPMSAIAGGYYAYSPVTLAPSSGFGGHGNGGSGHEAKITTEAKTTRPSGGQIWDKSERQTSNGKVSANSNPVSANGSQHKKSWLLSKFSLSTSNVNQQQQQQNSHAKPAASQQNGTNKDSSSCEGNKLQQQQRLPFTAPRDATSGQKQDTERITINGSGKLTSSASLYGRNVASNGRPQLELATNGRQDRNSSGSGNGGGGDGDHDDDDHDADSETATICNIRQQNGDADNNLMVQRSSSSNNNEKDEENDNDKRHQLLLIRPKSALSATNAELIKAQKSLALAAAAKVQRQQQRSSLRNDLLAFPEGQLKVGESLLQSKLLTVKTSQEHPAFWHHHASAINPTAGHNHHQLAGHDHHNIPRSGTNSAGMSDSSPSNNGAESDNSVQTTHTSTGSMNTQTSDSQQQQQQQPVVSSSKNPLNILSRILHNNNGTGNNKSSKSSLAHSPSKSSIANTSSSTSNSSATLRQQTKGGSLSSSPGSSSVSSSTNATTTSASQTSTAGGQLSPTVSNESPRPPINQLDQLGSRSRCPIVMTSQTANGTEQPLNAAGLMKPDTQNSSQAPKLPPKGVLKTTTPIGHYGNNYNNTTGQQQQQQQHHQPPVYLESSMTNGLPRVASCGQISSMSSNSIYKQQDQLYHNQQQQQLYSHLMMAHHYNGDTGHDHHQHHDQLQASLCNYHALSRSQPFQAQYSPYLPYNLGRYSIHEPCDPATATGSGRNLSGLSTTSATVDSVNDRLAPTGGAISNELYFMNTNGVMGHHYHHQVAPRFRQQPVDQLSYAQHHDGSIYIPQYADANGIVTTRDESDRGVTKLNGHFKFNNQLHPPTGRPFDGMTSSYQQQQRPKSSLDTFLLSSMHSGNNGHYASGMVPTNQAGNTIDVIDADHRLASYRVTPNATVAASGDCSFYTQNNSIYAGQQQNSASELTVLPANVESNGKPKDLSANGTQTPAAAAASPQSGQRARPISSTGPLLRESDKTTTMTQRNNWTRKPYKSLVHINRSTTPTHVEQNSTSAAL